MVHTVRRQPLLIFPTDNAFSKTSNNIVMTALVVNFRRVLKTLAIG